MSWYQIMPRISKKSSFMTKENNLGKALAGVSDFTFVVAKKNDLSIFYLRTPFQVEQVMKQFSVMQLTGPPEEVKDLSRYKYKAVFYYDEPEQFFEKITFRNISSAFATITDDIMVVVSAEYSKDFKEYLDKLSKKILSGKTSFLDQLFGKKQETKVDYEMQSKINQKLSQINYKTTITIYATNRPFLDMAIKLFSQSIIPHPEVEVFKLKKNEAIEILPNEKYFIPINDTELDSFLIIPEINSKVGASVSLPAVRFQVQPGDIIIGKNELGYDIPLSMVEMQSHAYVIGMTGSGKTNTLEVISHQIRNKWYNKAALWVIDPHGSMAKELLRSIDAIPGGNVDLYLKYRIYEDFANNENLDEIAFIPSDADETKAQQILMKPHKHVIDLRTLKDGYVKFDDIEIGVIPKDMPSDKAKEIIEKYEKYYDLKDLPNIYFFDPLEIDFQINPLDVPSVNEDTDIHIMNLVNEMRGIFEKIFSLDMTKAANVQMLISLGIQAIFEQKMAKEGRPPTLPELFDFLKELFLKIKDRQPIDDLLEGVQTDEVKELLELVPLMQSQSLVSTINRLKEFAIVKKVRDMFSGNTIDFLELTKPGNIVLWSLSKASIPETLNELIMGIIMMRLWFIAKYRATLAEAYSMGKISEPYEVTPVFVIIDEFQNIQKLQLIDVILTEARKFGIHLVMAHQNLKQLDDKLLDTVLNNTAVQIFMRTQGGDNERLGKHIKYDFREEISAILPDLGKGEAIVKKTPMRPGDPEYPPQKVKIFKAPDPYYPPRYIYDVILEMRKKYSKKAKEAQNGEEAEETVEIGSFKNIETAYDKISKKPEFYAILYSIIKNSKNPFDFTSEEGALKTKVGGTISMRPTTLLKFLSEMEKEGYIKIFTMNASGPGRPRDFVKLTPKGVDELIGDIQSVAPSPEGQFLLKKTIEQYIKESPVPIAPIIPPQIGNSPDIMFVPMRFDGNVRRFVPEKKYAWVAEIESPQEVESQQQQVSKNMIKDVNQQFIRIDSITMKSAKDKLYKIYESIPQVFKEKVYVAYYDDETDSIKEYSSDDTAKPPAIIEAVKE